MLRRVGTYLDKDDEKDEHDEVLAEPAVPLTLAMLVQHTLNKSSSTEYS